jgi:DNA-binding PucR family transcriptional regulator
MKLGAAEPRSPSLPASASEAERLSSLIEVSRSLNSKLDLRSIIRQILQAVLHLIPAADSGTLYIYEPDADRLVVYDTVGLGPEMYDVAVRPGRGITGRAFERQVAHLYPSGDAVVEHMSDGGDDNLRAYTAAAAGRVPPNSAMTAPMLYKDKTVGVLVAHNLLRPGIFTEFDLKLLDSLAQTAALAMANARLFEAEKEGYTKLEGVNRELVLQRDKLQRELTVRNLLSELARSDFTLQAVAGRLAEILRGQVWLIDSFHQVVASEPRVSRRAVHELDSPKKEIILNELRLAMRSRAIRQAALKDGSSLMIAPVCSGPDVDGFVLVELPDRVPDSVDETAVDSACLVIALRNLRERAQHDSELRSHGRVLGLILEGSPPAAAAGLQQLRPPLCLVVAQVRSADGANVTSDTDDTGFQQLQALVHQFEPRAVLTVHQQYLAILTSLADGRQIDSVVKSIEALAGRLREMDPALEAAFAVCESVDDLSLVSSAFHEGRLSLVARRQLGLAPRVSAIGDLRAYRLLLRSATDADVLELCTKMLAPVREYERQHGGALLATYRAYLAHRSSPKETARALGVHPHTVLYRLERLQSLTGLDVKRFEERLTLELAARILELAEA